MAAKTTSRKPKQKTDAPKRYISAVVFEVALVGETDWKLLDVMRHLFSKTPNVRLKGDTKTFYQAGNFRKEGESVWTGRLEMLRDSLTASRIVNDPKEGYQFVDDGRRPVTTSEDAAFFAFHAPSRLLVYRETGGMPYTRLQSYVRTALGREELSGVRIALKPRLVERPIREWFNTFTEVERVTLSYRHSQSPGNKNADNILTAYNAQRRIQTITAKRGESLNTDELLSTSREVGQAIDHLDKNRKNGKATINGNVDQERIVVDTQHPVERHLVPSLFSRRGIVGALASLVITLASEGSVFTPDDE